jgi:hypothetical protein
MWSCVVQEVRGASVTVIRWQCTNCTRKNARSRHLVTVRRRTREDASNDWMLEEDTPPRLRVDPRAVGDRLAYSTILDRSAYPDGTQAFQPV